MAITVQKQPNQFNFLKNPIGFKFNSDNRYSDPGSKATSELVWNGYALNNQTLQIEWGGGDVTFTFKTVPTDNGTDILIDTSNQRNFITQIVIAFEKNHLISLDFDIEQDVINDKVTLTGKGVGSYYYPTITENTSATMSETLTAGNDPVENENFKIQLRLLVNQHKASISNQRRYFLDRTISEDGGEFQLGDVLDSDLYGEGLPGSGVITDFNERIVMAIADWAEKYGNPLTVRQYSDSVFFYVFQGGLSKNVFSDFDFDQWITDKKFLTTYRNRRVFENQKEYLWFWNSAGNFQLGVKFFYTDESEEYYSIATKSDATNATLYCLSCGYSLFSGQVNGSKVLDHWEIFVAETGTLSTATLKSEKMVYSLNEFGYQEQTDLLFKNAFGLWEVRRAAGKMEATLSMSKEQAQRILELEYSKTKNSSITTKSSFRVFKKSNTGWLSRQEMQWLVEMLNSDVHYLDQGDWWLPVTINVSNVTLYDTDSGLKNGIEIEIGGDVDEINGGYATI